MSGLVKAVRYQNMLFLTVDLPEGVRPGYAQRAYALKGFRRMISDIATRLEWHAQDSTSTSVLDIVLRLPTPLNAAAYDRQLPALLAYAERYWVVYCETYRSGTRLKGKGGSKKSRTKPPSKATIAA